MIRQELRWVFLGTVIGLFIAVAPSCTGCGTKPCAQTCAGCCDSKGVCLGGTGETACGSGGALCATCSGGQACTAGVCATPQTDGGDTDGSVDGGNDAGPLKCTRDADCAYLHTGAVCDNNTGNCVMGRGCFDDTNCQIDDGNDPCYRYGTQCRCDLADKPDGGGTFNYNGTCRRRLGPCDECTADVECGQGIVFGPPDGIGEGVCRQLAGDMSGKKYCLYQRVGQCACGTVDNGEGYCRPQSNSCQQVGCNIDRDCPSGSVCTVNNPGGADGGSSCGGICVPRCRWDFVNKNLIAPGCRPGETCWVDSSNLDPNSIYFGSGRCRPPCGSNADCQQSPANPFGGTNLKCAGEQLQGGGLSDKRCRANGDCMDTAECPELPNNQPYLGYCDRAAFSCNTDCRTGADPVTGQAFKDCRTPYACARDAGVNVCKLQTCVEQGGAPIACSTGHYCCGEDKDQDGGADPCPAPSERDPAGCYEAPKPPFCTVCMSDDDCKNVQLPAWLSGANACAGGSRSPSCSPLKIKCLYAGDRTPGGNDGDNICAPATWNDNALTGGRPHSSLGCPSSYQVTFARPDLAQNGQDWCTSDPDCNQGTDAGRCGNDLTAQLPDGGWRKACLCTAGSGTSQCPNVDGGLYSECRTGVVGQNTYCVESVVCMPPPGYAYRDGGAPYYGCGL